MSQNRKRMSGKSRRVHHKRRADRRFDLQLIDEYLEGEDEDQRIIPIRYSGSFHPTVARLSDSVMESDDEVQLELPLKVHESNDPASRHDATPDEQNPPAGDHASAREGDATGGEEDTWVDERASVVGAPEPIRVEADLPEPLPNNRYEMFEFRSRKGPNGFSIRRFLIGCAMGGVAAVILLLLFNAVT